ncbi:hypothetical protein QFZ32_004219 [Streptomyces canus]|nr:hypothetical protein [Streptomyces canus]
MSTPTGAGRAHGRPSNEYAFSLDGLGGNQTSVHLPSDL